MYSLTKNKRLIFAGVIIASLFVVLFVIDKIKDVSNYKDIITAGGSYSSSLPNNFSSDVFDINKLKLEDIKTAEDGKIIGFVLHNNQADAFNQLKNCIEDSGWHYVESGTSTAASFYRDFGSHRWLFLNCIEIDGACSCVITTD